MTAVPCGCRLDVQRQQGVEGVRSRVPTCTPEQGCRKELAAAL